MGAVARCRLWGFISGELHYDALRLVGLHLGKYLSIAVGRVSSTVRRMVGPSGDLSALLSVI